MDYTDEKIKRIISCFGIEGELIELKANKHGHINSTYMSVFLIDGKIKKYTHQRINKNVFKHPDEVMDNIVRVTDYIDSNLPSDNKERLVLKVIRSLDNKPYYIDDEGEYWRTYTYIDDAMAYDRCTSEKIAGKLGEAIGNFQLQLSGFDGASLYPTIKNFHNMIWRYDELERAIKENRAGRLEEVKEAVDFLLANRVRGERIWRDYDAKLLPSRVTHNDTKINNVLFDDKTGEALAVIDLDTIMPGTILFDTGDMIRTSCNTADEDEKNLEKVMIDTKLYKALISGYYSMSKDFLTENEKNGLLESGRMMCQIMAVRFLTDYLDGDLYYNIQYPEHNKVRALNQIKLIKSIDDRWNELVDITNNIIVK